MTSNNKGKPEDYTEKSHFWDRVEKKIQSDFLCRPYVLDLIGNVKNKKVIDIGCGEGYVCRLLASKGAKVTGIDNSSGLIEKARKQEQEDKQGIDYFVDSALNLKKINIKKFDKAISVLVFGHFNKEEMNEAIRKTFQILKSKGEFVLAVPHPFMYVCKPETQWVDFNYKALDYFRSENAEITLYTKNREGFEISAKTHTIESYLNSLISNGFIIEKVLEPKPTKEDLETYPEMWGEEKILPTYLIIKTKKK